MESKQHGWPNHGGRINGRWSATRRYTFATMFVLAAFAVRHLLDPLMLDHAPFILFIPAVMLSAWFGGIGPALMAVAESTLLAHYFFIDSVNGWTFLHLPHLLATITYTFCAIFVSGLMNVIRKHSTQLVHEITARIETEAALQRAQQQEARHSEDLEKQVAQRIAALRGSIKDMESFCYTIAHDLRAPLRAMTGFTTALLEDYSSALDEDGKMYCTRIALAAARMDTMIVSLLDFGQVLHTRPQIELLNLREEVQRAVVTAGDQIDARRAEVIIEDISPFICANRVLLGQVLNNLLTNGLKFVAPEKKPRIRIFTRQYGQRVRLFIEDNGIGIESDHQKRIFEAFQRVTTSNVYAGTGIGLTIAQKAAEKMGGIIGVNSKVGVGSCFWIELSSHSRCPCDEKICATLMV